MSLIDIKDSTKKAEIVSQVSYLQSSSAPIDMKAEESQILLLQDQEKTIEGEEDKIEDI